MSLPAGPYRTRIKFCGMTRAADVDAAVSLGVDLVGFVLVPASPRCVTADHAESLRQRLPPGVASVALFKDASDADVAAALSQFRPDWLQFHGRESADFCGRWNTPYLRAVAMRDTAIDLVAEAAAHPGAAALLLDGHAPGEMGGSGQAFDWARARADIGRPLFVAGGLDAGNVARAVAQAWPYAVDVSSGIESAPGIKDSGKMADFVAAVREADARRMPQPPNRS